jgi:integrase
VASIRRRELVDGSVRYDVIYRDPDGRQRVKTYRKKRSALAFANTTEADKQRGQWIDPAAGKVTFEAHAREWLAMQTFERSTRDAVEQRLRLHVFPVLGRSQLRNVRPSTVQSWLRSIDHLAPRTRKLIFEHVSTVFGAAVDDALIARNPCRAGSVTRPKAPPKKVVPWEQSVVVAVRDELPARYQVVAMLCAGFGLRQGEAFGLSPDDIDWLRGMVRVRRQVKLIGSRQVFAPPKYRRERDVPLAASVRDWLAAYLVDWPTRSVTLPWLDPDEGRATTVKLMVTTRESKAVHRGYFNARVWKPALRRAGVPAGRENGTHALRHFYASALLDGGENIRALSEYLGHADPGFTLRVYTHLMPSSTERTRTAIDLAFADPQAPAADVTGMSRDSG